MYKEILYEIIDLQIPTGREKKFFDYIQEKTFELDVVTKIDRKKNCFVEFNHNAANTVVFITHIDQISFVVFKIEKHKARFISLSRSREEEIINQMVIFPKGEVGIIKKDDSFYVDISGAENISVGDFFCFLPRCIFQGDYILGTGLDNKLACSLLVSKFDYFKKNKYFNIVCLFSSQEEVGARGIYNFAPKNTDIIINIDVTPSNLCYKNTSVNMGAGAAIKVCDSGTIVDEKMVKSLVEISGLNEVEYQLEIIDRGSTDLVGIERKECLAHVASISIPCDYGHNSIEKMHKKDVESVSRMIDGICENGDILFGFSNDL